MAESFLTRWFGKKAPSQIPQTTSNLTDGITYSMLLGSGKRSARSRAEIMTKYHLMLGDPIISSAIRLHVTAALGCHESTGQVVFIEAKPGITAKEKKAVNELKADLEVMLNQCVHFLAFNAAGFGDSYARLYSRKGEGVLSITADESVYPSLVQPFEQGGKTVGFLASAGQTIDERLTVLQMARVKMPRMLYIPQTRALEKSMALNLTEDDPDLLPILPSLVGGSFLEAAEEPYDNLLAALAALKSNRILSAIDETLLTVNYRGMTLEQQKAFSKTFTELLKKSKERAQKAIINNEPVGERIFNVLPVHDEKQVAQIAPFSNTGGANPVSIEDVMFYAKLLGGALGTDISMIGFADLLSGGLGDGGFFRTSAQTAERSRIIRTAIEECFNFIIDVHTYQKNGTLYDESTRPYSINFYGAISALEAEKQATVERATGSTATIVGLIEQLRGLELPTETVSQILSKMAKLDEDLADMLAESITATPEAGTTASEDEYA